MKPNLKKLSKTIQNAIQTQELTSVLPDRLEVVRKNKLHLEYKDANGFPFKSFAEWLNANIPYGAGVAQTNSFVNHRQLFALCENYKKLQQEIENAMALLKRPRRGERRDLTSLSDNDVPAKRGTSKDYLLQRLRVDHPEHYEKFLMREPGYTSAKAAARSAGIIKKNAPSTATNLARAKSAYRKMTAAERKQFTKWIKDGAE